MTNAEFARAIADMLIGQCVISLDQALLKVAGFDGIERAPRELLEQVDELVFYCDGCGWYCDTEELNETNHGDQFCEDCAEENNAGIGDE